MVTGRLAVQLSQADAVTDLAETLILRGFNWRLEHRDGCREVSVEESREEHDLRVLEVVVAIEQWLTMRNEASVVLREGDRVYTLRSAAGRALIERASALVQGAPEGARSSQLAIG